jgi:hypothetical protein
MEHLCPNCGDEMVEYPHCKFTFECLECGYTAVYTKVMSFYNGLARLNDHRGWHVLIPLTVLPKQDQSLVSNPKPEDE